MSSSLSSGGKEDRMDEEPPVAAGELIKGALAQLRKRPFLHILALSIFVSAVASSFADEIDGFGIVSSIALAVVSAYLQIALVLAAADPNPSGSADDWIKAAFKRRCFWRFTFASLFSFILVAAGLVVLVVPGFIVGAYLGMAAVAAVLERSRPGDSLRRSVELAKPARRALGIIFGIFVIVPNASLQVAIYFGQENVPLGIWIALELISVVLFLVGLLALTRAFLILGGTREPLSPRKPWPRP